MLELSKEKIDQKVFADFKCITQRQLDLLSSGVFNICSTNRISPVFNTSQDFGKIELLCDEEMNCLRFKCEDDSQVLLNRLTVY